MAPSARSLVGVLRLMAAVAVAGVAVMASPTSTLQWNIGTNGRILYALDCDRFGANVQSSLTSGADGGGLCIQTRDCTRCTWRSGTCYLKKGGTRPSAAIYVTGAVCGKRRW